MKDKLLIASKYKKTIDYILNICDNYPHKYLEMKTNIVNTTFEILENIYISNIDSKNKIVLIPKIKMLDYYLKISYKKGIISRKKYEVVSNYLLEIMKMIMSWMHEESK